ncbi:MAG TPA: hypothetical protein PKA42_03610 [Candidatus Paceibacterota bacterium]|nr:hypothetical protein [Candidatus Paceibacterota bacterium]HMO83227.1 hypothetical protein [Candidatus Paceibacterota bacterium]
MKISWRITTLLLITWLLVGGLFIIASAFLLLYLYYFRGYELVVVGILIDGYYQYFYEWPLFSLSMLSIVILANLIKPHLLMYNVNNEMV